MPVAYIIAIVLGVIVLVLLAYLFFSEGGIFSGAVAEQTCVGKFLSYCNFWSICSYGDCNPGGEDFFTSKGNKECGTFKSKIAPGNPEDECRKRLNQPASPSSTSTCKTTCGICYQLNLQKCDCERVPAGTKGRCGGNTVCDAGGNCVSP